MANVKVFFFWKMDKQMGQKLYGPDLLMQVHKNNNMNKVCNVL